MKTASPSVGISPDAAPPRHRNGRGATPERLTPPEWTRWSAADYREICHIKRFTERWNADRAFREEISSNPAAGTAKYDLDVDAVAIRPIWDPEMRLELFRGALAEDELPAAVRNYRRFMAEKLKWRQYFRAAGAPTDPRWRTWRQRQIVRATHELGPAWTEQNIFDTACYEISKGCSVGCWFCGVSAPRLGDHFRHTPANSRLFRGILQLIAELCGLAAVRAQFLYWASDPLDNPDYEAFCSDFRDVVGEYPQLTTALAHKDPERTRTLLARVRGESFSIHRFSVLSLKLLDRIHRLFSPEEMGHVECVVQCKDSVLIKANAGRFRERVLSNPELLRRETRKFPLNAERALACDEYLGPATIACVAGFLFNLVERTVKLISPCKASDRWPLGYIVHGEGTFRGARDLRPLLEGLIDEHMPAAVPPHRPVRFRDGLGYRRSAVGFEVWTVYGGFRYGAKGRAAYFGALGDLVREGRHDRNEIVERLLARHGVMPGDTLATLDRIFDQGLLSEEPEAPAAAVRNAQLVQLGHDSAG